mgnify:CR=1 FL=1
MSSCAVGSDSGQTADAPLSGLRRSMVQEWQSSGGSWFAWFPDDDVQVDRGDPFPAWLIGALVLAALAHANGSHQHSEPSETPVNGRWVDRETGLRVSFNALQSLHRWPSTQ